VAAKSRKTTKGFAMNSAISLPPPGKTKTWQQKYRENREEGMSGNRRVGSVWEGVECLRLSS